MTALFVPDANVTGAWLLDETATAAEEALLQSLAEGARARVPSIWSFEVANILRKARRAGTLTQQQSERAFQKLRILPIEIEREALPLLFHSVSALADEQDLSIYDAAYLELARKDRLPLATRDRKLRSAAESIGVKLIG